LLRRYVQSSNLLEGCRTLVSAGAGEPAKIWDAGTGTLRREITIKRNALRFSPDGSVLACATDTGVQLLASSLGITPGPAEIVRRHAKNVS
jgi:hypothetical protein